MHLLVSPVYFSISDTKIRGTISNHGLIRTEGNVATGMIWQNAVAPKSEHVHDTCHRRLRVDGWIGGYNMKDLI